MRPANQKIPITAATLKASVQTSLRHLRTDYLDVLALHDPTPEEAASEEIIETLNHLIQDGLVRCAAIAGARDSVEAGVNASPVYSVGQVANGPAGEELDEIFRSRDRKLFPVTYGALQVTGALDRLSGRLNRDPGLRARFEELGYSGAPRNTAAAVLIDCALVKNSEGVVLLSMFSSKHLERNVNRATAVPSTDLLVRVAHALRNPK
jgi:aryl-alcohol dehydrogenase-like predicted oxidoreductase